MREDKRRMMQFILDRIEDSNLFDINKYNLGSISVSKKPKKAGKKTVPVHIKLHNNQSKMTKSQYQRLLSQNRHNGVYTSNAFYKDDETYMVRLAWRAETKKNRSLKQYPKEIRDSIIHLRGIEKLVLAHQFGDNMLVYYQPETNQLEESLRFYEMNPSLLDYKHLSSFHDAYDHVNQVEESIDYSIPKEIYRVDKGGITLKHPQHKKNRELILVIKPFNVEEAKKPLEKDKEKQIKKKPQTPSLF